MNTPIKFKRYDQVGKITAYENGELSEPEAIELFQHMIDNGTVWHLQGSYVQTAHALIMQGVCKANPRIGL